MTDEEFTRKLNAQCDKFKDKPFDINGEYNILTNKWRTTAHRSALLFFKNSKFYEVESLPKNIKFDYAMIYGHNAKLNEKILDKAISLNIPVLLCEDGFIRGYDTYANKRQDPKYKQQCSLTVDRVGFNYDASRCTDLERLLSDYQVIDEQIDFSKKTIRRILEQKISKYNHQPCAEKRYGRPDRRKVLVVDQSYNDWSIKISGGTEKDFESMLRRAVDENPECDILVKVHPDTIARRKIEDNRLPLGYYEKIESNGNVFVVADGVNPYSLLEQVDEVYVYSTQLGFEALLAGKKVHTFGTPFYAGWGLTDDARKFPNRTRNLSLEEMFYIVYCVYTSWNDPIKNQACGVEQAIDYIEQIKLDYEKNVKFNHSITWCVDSDLNNNVMALQSIRSFMLNTSTTNDFYIITCEDNPFIFYLKKIKNLKILFAGDFLDRIMNEGNRHLSKFTYARLMLFDKKSIFSKYKFNLYVDNDTIAMRNIDKNLLGVGNSMDKAIAIAKEDEKNNASLKKMKEFCESEGLSYDGSHYGNAGVLLINNQKILESDLEECIKLSKYEFPACDQGLINYYFQGRIQSLKGKYNSYEITNTEREPPVIRHYVNKMRRVDNNDLFSKNYIKYVFNGLEGPAYTPKPADKKKVMTKNQPEKQQRFSPC